MHEIQMRSVEALIPYAKNSRTHSPEQIAQIAASIKEFGWTTPIFIDGNNGIIAGHGRLLAARKLGMADVQVIELSHLSDAQRRAYILADNKLALNAGWDNELLSLELKELEDLDFDLELTGFSEEEIAALLPDVLNPGLTDEDAVPETPVNPISVLGDVWILGKHRVMCGDATSVDDWAINVVGPKSHCIVDPFGGTGTTLIAAEKANKAARLIEIDPLYVDIIIKRWQDFTGRQATLEGEDMTFDEIGRQRGSG